MRKILNRILILVSVATFTSCGSVKQITLEEYTAAGFTYEGPHGIITFIDYKKGLEYAKQQNKPVLLYFTGITVINCRKMEEFVWTEGNILNLLKNDVVLISLYVDRRTKLPKQEQYISEITGKKVQLVGQKWLELEQTRYQKDSQPLYVIQDTTGKDLTIAIGYTPNPVEYEKWLKDGIDTFKKENN